MPRQFPTPQLGSLIRDYRINRGLTQQQLADAVNLPRADIGKLEVGYYAQPNSALLDRIARTLQVEVEEFYDLVDYEPQELPAYLRSKYQLPSRAAAEAEEYFKGLQAKYGVNPEGGDHGN
jgi:transcriptional regulator with XRE-family HTH domain